MLKSKEKQWLKQTRKAIKRDIGIVNAHVAQGNISTKEADHHLSSRYGTNYHGNLEAIEKTLKRDTVQKVGMGAVLAILLIPAFFLGSGITGFVARTIDKPVVVDVDQTFTEPIIFITRIDQKITSLRATGVYTGSGSLHIYHIDGSGNQQLLFSHEQEVIPDDAIFLQEQAPVQERRITFTGQCDQTCQIESEGPHQLRIDISDGALDLESLSYTTRVVLEEVEPSGEGVKEELLELKTPEPVSEPDPIGDVIAPIQEPGPAQDTERIPADAPVQENPEPVEELPIEEPLEEIVEEVVEDTPEEVVEQPPQDFGGEQSIKCRQDADCPIGTCGKNMYQGKETEGSCVADSSYCVGPDRLLYVPGDRYEDSVCYGSEVGGSVWLADDGGWQVQRRGRQTLAVIDKYGSMGLAGEPNWESDDFAEGWQLTRGGKPVISVDRNTGDLYALGELFEQVTSLDQEGEAITNSDGQTVAIMGELGDVYVAGDFAYAVTLA